MNKLRIAIASVLKPVTEPRAFTKLALSLRETNKYHLNIIGFCAKKTPILQDIQFTCVFKRNRTHYSRILAPLKFLAELFSYRPHLVIVTTYELLPMALLGKLFLKYKLIYDLQENYHKNVLLNKTTPKWVRAFLAYLIKGIEGPAHPFIDHYFFAERSYPKEFPYITQYTVLENKYHGKVIQKKERAGNQDRTVLLISGTITPVFGIENALKWFLSLHQEMPGICLQIIGHVPLQEFKRQLEEWTQNHPQIKLNLSNHPLPHSLLYKELLKADVVLMPYENLHSIRYKIPTKLYESIALQKPILISANPLWQEIIGAYPAGMSIDFSSIHEAKNHLTALMAMSLYKNMPAIEVTWESEKLKLLKVIQHFLS